MNFSYLACDDWLIQSNNIKFNFYKTKYNVSLLYNIWATPEKHTMLKILMCDVIRAAYE